MEQSNNEIKTRSIRADNENFEKFKRISENFPNQAQALEALISAYEIEKSKTLIPGRQTEIETFTTHVQKLNEIYNHSLMLNHDAEARIRMEFERQLSSKDITIQELQEKTQKVESVKQENEEQKQHILRLQKEIDLLNIAKDKTDGIIKSLTETVTEYKEQVKESVTQKKYIADLQNQVTELTYKINDLSTVNTRQGAELKKVVLEHNKEIEKIKADNEEKAKLNIEKINLAKGKEILELERKCTDKLNAVHKEYQQQIKELLSPTERNKK